MSEQQFFTDSQFGVLHAAKALAELDAASIRLYCGQQRIDFSPPMGRAMIQMVPVFGEQEKAILRDRVAGLNRVRQEGGKKAGPQGGPEGRERHQDASKWPGMASWKFARMAGCGCGTVWRVKLEMAEGLVEAA